MILQTIFSKPNVFYYQMYVFEHFLINRTFLFLESFAYIYCSYFLKILNEVIMDNIFRITLIYKEVQRNYNVKNIKI